MGKVVAEGNTGEGHAFPFEVVAVDRPSTEVLGSLQLGLHLTPGALVAGIVATRREAAATAVAAEGELAQYVEVRLLTRRLPHSFHVATASVMKQVQRVCLLWSHQNCSQGRAQVSLAPPIASRLLLPSLVRLDRISSCGLRVVLWSRNPYHSRCIRMPSLKRINIF